MAPAGLIEVSRFNFCQLHAQETCTAATSDVSLQMTNVELCNLTEVLQYMYSSTARYTKRYYTDKAIFA